MSAKQVSSRGGRGDVVLTAMAAAVVLALGAEPDDSLVRSLQGLGKPITAVGDCARLGYIEGALHDGHRAGREV